MIEPGRDEVHGTAMHPDAFCEDPRVCLDAGKAGSSEG